MELGLAGCQPLLPMRGSRLQTLGYGGVLQLDMDGLGIDLAISGNDPVIHCEGLFGRGPVTEADDTIDTAVFDGIAGQLAVFGIHESAGFAFDAIVTD